MNLLTIASLVAAGLAGAWALTLTTREREESPSPSGDGPGHDGARVGVPFPATDVMEHLTDAFFHVDREWRLTYFNPAAERYLEGLGHDPRKRVGRSFVEAFAGQRAEDAEFRKLRDAMETGSPVTYTTRAETLDAWLEIRAFPSAGGLAVYVRDVTERREAEERFQTLVEHAPEAIVVVDMDEGRVVELNRNAVELYGRTEEELRETVPYQFSPPVQPDGRPSVEKANELLQRALDGESPVFEWVHLTGDGREIQTEVRLVRLPSRNRRLVRGSVTDITDRKRAEEALRESEERFRDLFHADVAGNFVT
ncbi:MAG: PAS domain S-box protein, partial [Gemmatimonadetes bacterium]|nr:PAS domain S-box protein [Gemmatimonadota bacterium]NIR76841.1 PAS domain S-box protein [Gemmatimonadota bacterium]NIT85360.1 PAS domain S-box protein [Gemmatimonadota bacterium]NIU29181.1 PAS domain S-box protein [Gemmatimonadota bacterium]NIU34278.1 PAS domain S-box protein [Gemmatimonadota bacterium]